ncbi:hypothetical protein RMATCC62417_16251 [Rhizopus microsporus]|nr:hypothetical protein RMATCC62417_16251 [Rhizopus microsporus]
MNKRQKRQRIVASDVQWCIDNKDNLTCKAFAEHHILLDKQYAINRYQSIISRYLPQYKIKLMDNLSSWKQTSGFTLYWLERKQLRARLDAQESCSNYVENVLGEQTATLTANFQTTTLPDAIDTRSVTPDNVEFASSNVIYRHDHVEDSRSSPLPTTILRPSTVEREDDGPVSPSPTTSASSSRDINARPVVPWMFNGSNVAELFQTFQRKVAALSRANLLQIETSIHEILALSHIFLLCPSQHSEQMIDVFSKEILYDIHQSFVQESMDKNIDITDEICANIARIVDSVEQKVRSKDEAAALLSQLCINLDEHASSVIRGIVKAMTELPLQAINDKTSIGEYELTTAYFHPLLSSILSNPDKQVLLRWTNIETDSSAKKKKTRRNDYQAESVGVWAQSRIWRSKDCSKHT